MEKCYIAGKIGDLPKQVYESLFSGWTFAMEDEDKIYLDGVLFGSDCQLIYDKEEDVIWIDSEHIKADLLHSIEDLDYTYLPLTPTALKEIYGS